MPRFSSSHLSSLLSLAGLACGALVVWGCSDAGGPAVVGLDTGLSANSGDNDACVTPSEGCECDAPGQVVDCGVVKEDLGDDYICRVGKRTCDEGKWSACEGVAERRVGAPAAGDRSTQGLGPSESCSTNPCDPYCNSFTDTGTGIIAPGFDSMSGLKLEGSTMMSMGTPCTSLELTPDNPTMTVTSIEIAPPNGLFGEYFSGYDQGASQIPAGWTPTATRIDPEIQFAMGGGSPGISGIGNDNFSIRWTGQVTPSTSGTYRFATYSDDGMRLWMNGTLIINRWAFQAPTWVESADFALTAGDTYDIRVEYFEAGGGAHAELFWSHPVDGWQIIPSSVYTPPAAMAAGFQTSPSEIDFSADLKPDGCYDGASTPLYSLDRFDSSNVDSDGLFQTFAPVAGPVEVSAYIAEFRADTTVDVLIDANEVDSAPAGAETNHAKAPSGTDPATVLYPYEDTVFPLGIEPPVLQWDDGGTSASSVKVSLRYPSSGPTIFNWSEIVAETSPPRFGIPEYAWKAFEQTAKGDEGVIVLQRVRSGTPYEEIVRPITFATAPLRGKIYYTQYGRDGSNKAMIADPSGATRARDAYNGGSDGCPVCHSVSANGNVFVTADRGWSTQGGFSNVRADGLLDPTTDHPGGSPYWDGSNDWRGFAWAPLTPDGQYALAANNIYGNTYQNIIGIDTDTDTLIVPDTFLSGGHGTGLKAKFYHRFGSNRFKGRRWYQITPHIDYYYDASSGPGGHIGTDFSARFDGKIQAYFSEDYTFYLTSTDGVKLRINNNVVIDDFGYNGASRTETAVVPMVGGQVVDLRLEWDDTGGEAELFLEWESPSTPRQRVPVTQLIPDGNHFVETTYYSSNNFTNPYATVLEPMIYNNWGSSAFVGLPNDNHSTEWRGRIEGPYTNSNFQLCVRSDDDVEVDFNGSTVISQNGVVDTCSGNLYMKKGTKYDLAVRHREFGGSSYVELTWQGSRFGRTPVQSAFLHPPSSWSKPNTGLRVAIYDGPWYTSDEGTNPEQDTYFTYMDTTDVWYGNSRPNHSVITNNDNWAMRFTGKIEMPCDGMVEFRSVADDAASLWIDQNRLLTRSNNGTSYGGAYFESGKYDFKYEFQEGGGHAYGELYWIPHCTGETSFVQIPSSAFSPNGTGSAGFVRGGGDNGNGTGYFVWETPEDASDPPEDVTADSPGNWGLGTTAMMVPAFSPDSTALVFVDGDSSGGAGWRKGLSVFDFDQDAQIFWNRRNVVNTYPYGHVIKWPAFESDSRTVLYSASTPVDWCCKGGWTRYGHMAPTNYFETVGMLYSVDTQAATPEAVELKVLNEGERPEDANKVYQPTVLPQSAAGYRWVVFTSTRPYGNTFNNGVNEDYSDPDSFTPMVRNDTLQSTLWIAAIDDEVSASTDRSHPAFLLQNQNYSESDSGGVLNERGFWALDACRPVGTGAESECEVDEDCCGGTGDDPSAQCALDVPVSSPPTRHCKNKPSIAMCVARGDSCTGGDCCLGDVCVNAVCTAPPPISTMNPINFTRDFESQCMDTQTTPIWRYFDWQGESPGDSYVEFYAQSADDPADFETLPVAPDPVMSTQVVGVGVMSGATVMGWVGNNVGALLDAAGLPHREHLRITMRFVPPTDGSPSPLLTSWRQAYSCIPDH